ncbi:MAG: hypothetical protein OXL98_11875 [Acidimicrobiaceae bacterium]|nr:hypothetical protein [Acidimicrobiaceae bacterium]
MNELWQSNWPELIGIGLGLITALAASLRYIPSGWKRMRQRYLYRHAENLGLRCVVIVTDSQCQ